METLKIKIEERIAAHQKTITDFEALSRREVEMYGRCDHNNNKIIEETMIKIRELVWVLETIKQG